MQFLGYDKIRETKRKDAPFVCFNHNLKKERCTGCLPNVAGWARGHLEVNKSMTKPKSSKSEKALWKRNKKKKKKGGG